MLLLLLAGLSLGSSSLRFLVFVILIEQLYRRVQGNLRLDHLGHRHVFVHYGFDHHDADYRLTARSESKIRNRARIYKMRSHFAGTGKPIVLFRCRIAHTGIAAP